MKFGSERHSRQAFSAGIFGKFSDEPLISMAGKWLAAGSFRRPSSENTGRP
jgi:hypothetical protein